MSSEASKTVIPSRIIFGSCSSQQHPRQPLWSTIRQRNATAFVWGGDAVYADDRVEWLDDGIRFRRLDATPDHLRKLYGEQRQRSDYRLLLEQEEPKISIFGTIDDHDYGINNGDKTFEWRNESIFEFVKFLNLPKDSAMYQRGKNGLGVYGVQVYDFNRDGIDQHRLLSDEEAGLDPDVVPNVVEKYHDTSKLVAVFVLDIRSNKSPWKKDKFVLDQYAENADWDGDFLGETQWKWFETALSRSEAAVNVVVSGIQVHAQRFYDPGKVENWAGFPSAQQRLYQALLQPNVKAPILISGDVHQAQFLRKDCRQSSSDSSLESSISPKLNYRPLYEITTSGMTHSWGTKVCGRANLNPFCQLKYFNAIYGPLLDIVHRISPWTELMVSSDPANPGLQYSLELNVAELEFDWHNQAVIVSVLGENDNLLLRQEWPFEDLTTLPLSKNKSSSSEESPVTLVQQSEFDLIQRLQSQRLNGNKVSERTSNGFNNVRSEDADWVCVQYRGLPGKAHFAFGVASGFIMLTALGAILPLTLLVLITRALFRRIRQSKIKKD